MTKLIDKIPRKSFHTCGLLSLIAFGFVNVVLISIFSKLRFDSAFHCSEKTSSEENVQRRNYINSHCYNLYNKKFHFVTIFFFLSMGNLFFVTIVSLAYGCLVKGRVEAFDYSTSITARYNNDHPKKPAMLLIQRTDENPRDVRQSFGRFSTFQIYIAYLIARILPMSVLAILVFITASIPNNFPCPWGPEMQRNSRFSSNDTVYSQSNSTSITCTKRMGETSKAILDLIAGINVAFVVFTCFELAYIAWLTYNDNDFKTDSEFCTVYLLRKRKRIRKFINKFRDGFNPPELFPLHDFGGLVNSSRNLKNWPMYVNAVIQEGREHFNAYPRKYERHKIYQSHLETPSKEAKLTSLADIFKPPCKQSQAYPRTILVIGRPGIGKTMLTRKLLHQWKRKKDEFWNKKIVIVLRFRNFRNKSFTLRHMLRNGDGLSSLTTTDFETLYNAIWTNPTKTVLIFDGLDELDDDRRTESFINLDDEMPVFSILKMLVQNTGQLRDVTVLVTSRPTARYLPVLFEHFQKEVEILGFLQGQIEEYIKHFCGEKINSTIALDENISPRNELTDINNSLSAPLVQNNNPTNDNSTRTFLPTPTSELILSQIKGSPELLSFCYLPVNSYLIVCLTLKELIQNDESMQEICDNLHEDIPKTTTELYAKALKVLLCRHHPKLKFDFEWQRDYFSRSLPKEVDDDLVKLAKLAKDKIDKGKYFFELKHENFELGRNCGLLHELPGKQYCFLHLTLQEFLAASHVVNDKTEKIDIGKFLTTHVDDSKWHLVIQFIAGLVGDEISKATNNREEALNNVKESFGEWASLLRSADPDERKKALLGIKCLNELQDIGFMRRVSSDLVHKDGKLRLNDLDITTPSDSKALFEFLGSNGKLKQLELSLNLNYNNMTESVIEYLSDALKCNMKCNLTKLSIHTKNAENKEFKYLCNVMKRGSFKKTELRLNSTLITPQGTCSGVTYCTSV